MDKAIWSVPRWGYFRWGVINTLFDNAIPQLEKVKVNTLLAKAIAQLEKL
jgi:hypothetical protein